MQEIQLDHPDTAAIGGGAITPPDRTQPIIIGPICDLPYLPPGGCIPPYETQPVEPPFFSVM